MTKATGRLQWTQFPVIKLWLNPLSALSAIGTALAIFFWPSVPVRGVGNWLFIYVNTPYLTLLYPAIAVLSGVLVGLFVYRKWIAPHCPVGGANAGTIGSATGVFLSVCPTCVPAISLLFPLGFNVAMSRLAPVFSIMAIPILLFAIWQMHGFRDRRPDIPTVTGRGDMSRRWLSILLLFVALWPAMPQGSTAAEHLFVLTPELKAQLAELEVLRGGDIDPLELDSKAVVIGFFASWCAPCRKGFIEQRKLLERLGRDRLKIIAINWFEDATRYPGESMRLTRLLDRLAPGITAIEGSEAIYDAFGRFRGFPALFAFDRTGEEIYRFTYLGGPGNVNADYQSIAALIEGSP